MKYNKIFRTLVLAIILSLLIIALPTIPAYAITGDEYISLSRTSGEIGDRIYIYGSDFEPANTTYIYFSSDRISLGYDIDYLDAYQEVRSGDFADADGDLDSYFTVPYALTWGVEEDVHGGDYYVYVTYTRSGEIVARATFTVIGGEISISPRKGNVGDEVEISGQDFGNRESITVKYDGVEVDIESGDYETDSSGDFEGTIIIIPESTAGSHTITVIGDESYLEDEATFTVEPEIIVSPTSGPPDTKLTVTGTGFGNGKYVTIYFNGATVTTSPSSVKTNTVGSFEATFDIPQMVPDIYDVEAEDTAVNSDTAKFTIAASISLSPATGNVGMEITVTGTGFTAGRTVTITYDGNEVTLATPVTVGADGTFSATFNALASASGAHTITATDGINTKSKTFTMESTPPPTPVPLEPFMDSKAKSQAYFDWEDVTDPSLPVTYTLQVTTDENFTEESIVLEKEGLTDSEYTLTKEERLPSTKKEAPYYWRVTAIDGASNESEWTGAGSFYVGFTFEMPQWVIYTLIGLGGLLLLVFSFWIGRRTAYSSFP